MPLDDNPNAGKYPDTDVNPDPVAPRRPEPPQAHPKESHAADKLPKAHPGEHPQSIRPKPEQARGLNAERGLRAPSEDELVAPAKSELAPHQHETELAPHQHRSTLTTTPPKPEKADAAPAPRPRRRPKKA